MTKDLMGNICLNAKNLGFLQIVFRQILHYNICGFRVLLLVSLTPICSQMIQHIHLVEQQYRPAIRYHQTAGRHVGLRKQEPEPAPHRVLQSKQSQSPSCCV